MRGGTPLDDVGRGGAAAPAGLGGGDGFALATDAARGIGDGFEAALGEGGGFRVEAGPAFGAGDGLTDFGGDGFSIEVAFGEGSDLAVDAAPGGDDGFGVEAEAEAALGGGEGLTVEAAFTGGGGFRVEAALVVGAGLTVGAAFTGGGGFRLEAALVVGAGLTVGAAFTGGGDFRVEAALDVGDGLAIEATLTVGDGLLAVEVARETGVGFPPTVDADRTVVDGFAPAPAAPLVPGATALLVAAVRLEGTPAPAAGAGEPGVGRWEAGDGARVPFPSTAASATATPAAMSSAETFSPAPERPSGLAVSQARMSHPLLVRDSGISANSAAAVGGALSASATDGAVSATDGAASANDGDGAASAGGSTKLASASVGAPAGACSASVVAGSGAAAGGALDATACALVDRMTGPQIRWRANDCISLTDESCFSTRHDCVRSTTFHRCAARAR